MNPPRIFEETLTEIAAAIESIKDQSAILDSIRLYHMDQGVDKVQRTVVEMDIRHTKVEIEIRGKSRLEFKLQIYLLMADNRITKEPVGRSFGKVSYKDSTRPPICHRGGQ